MFHTLQRLYAHAAWADAGLLAVIAQHHASDARILQLMGHVVAAERIWISRILARDLGAFAPWTALTLTEMQRLDEDNRREYHELVRSLAPERLDDVVAYRTSKGDAMRSRLGDILLHIALHGAYHRGQIAAAIRATGDAPPAADYIMFCRTMDA